MQCLHTQIHCCEKNNNKLINQLKLYSTRKLFKINVNELQGVSIYYMVSISFIPTVKKKFLTKNFLYAGQ